MSMQECKVNLMMSEALMRIMRNKCSVNKAIMTILTIMISSTAVASPDITLITEKSNVLTIDGSYFGTKPHPSPIKYTDFETDSVGQVPVGWDAPSIQKV